MRTRLVLVLLGIVAAPAFGAMRITFVDTGQSDGSVTQIDQPNGEPFTIVVDGGDNDSDLKNNLPNILTNDPTIELVVLSHPHKDHVGGLDWLVKSSGIPIQQVWWTEETFTQSDYKTMRSTVSSKHIPAERPTESLHHIAGFSNFGLRVFNNGQEFPGTDGSDINNDSLVFQVIYQPATNVRVTVLFTGDIETEQGEMLVNQFGDDLRSDIVKVPHHGSANLFPDFPARVHPRFAFVSSSGTNKTFKHPRKTALDLYAQNGKVFCTCDAAGKNLNFTATVSDTGTISVTPSQPPYFVWAVVSGKLKRRTITP